MSGKVGRSFATNVAGVSFRQGAVAACRVGDICELRREPQNRYDKNAVAVWCRGAQIGYVGRGLSMRLAPFLDMGMVISVWIEQLLGGQPGKPTVGVRLRMRRRDKLGQLWEYANADRQD